MLRIAEAPVCLFPGRVNPTEPDRLWKTCLLRILADVLHNAEKMFFIANDSIITFFLPKYAAALHGLVDRVSDETFPAIQDLFQLPCAKRLHNDVNMVRHHNKRICRTAIVLEKEHRFRHNVCILRIAKYTFAIPFVQPAFDTNGMASSEVLPLSLRAGFGMSTLPFSAPALEFRQFMLRKRVS